jgi:hypothetical protein
MIQNLGPDLKSVYLFLNFRMDNNTNRVSPESLRSDVRSPDLNRCRLTDSLVRHSERSYLLPVDKIHHDLTKGFYDYFNIFEIWPKIKYSMCFFLLAK